MPIEVPNFKLPEVPQGEELFKKTLDFARRSLTETYPILNREPYTTLLPAIDTIAIVPNRQMQEIEKEEIVKNNVLYHNLILAGLPTDYFDGEFLSSSKTFVYRDQSSKILISKEAIVDISTGDDIDRVKTAYFLGLMLIQDFMQNAPIKRDLPTFPWKELMKGSLKNGIFDALRESAPELQMEKLNIAELAEASLVDTKGQFTAQGGMVVLSFSHKDSTEEYHMGSNLNTNIALGLSHEPSLKLTKLFNSAFLGRFQAKPLRKTLEMIASEKFCADLGIPPRKKDFPKKTEITRENYNYEVPNDFNNHELIDYYLESLIPLYYIASDTKSGLNPWTYPS